MKLTFVFHSSSRVRVEGRHCLVDKRKYFFLEKLVAGFDLPKFEITPSPLPLKKIAIFSEEEEEEVGFEPGSVGIIIIME